MFVAAASFRRTVFPLVLLFVAVTPVAQVARAADDAAAVAAAVKEPAKFVRFSDENGGGKLETAVVTYKNDAGVELKLVSAIHIGERSYFESLNKDFEAEDAVLYELVKEKGAPLPGPDAIRKKAADGDANANPIGQLQRFLKDTLDLEFQLDVVDYTRKNFVHADMDKDAFEKAQAERGESFEMLMLQQLMAAMKNPQAHALPGVNGNGDDTQQMFKDLVKLVTRPDIERQVKTILAKQMDQMQDMAMGLDGPGGSVIVTERNKAALKVLEQSIKDGKKKIAIFYGAAHMPDLSKRVREMGFKPSAAVEWKAAWDLHIRADQPSAVEKLLNDFIDALDEPAAAPAKPDGVF